MKDEPFRFKVALKEERAFNESEPSLNRYRRFSLRQIERFRSLAIQSSNAEIEVTARFPLSRLHKSHSEEILRMIMNLSRSYSFSRNKDF